MSSRRLDTTGTTYIFYKREKTKKKQTNERKKNNRKIKQTRMKNLPSFPSGDVVDTQKELAEDSTPLHTTIHMNRVTLRTEGNNRHTKAQSTLQVAAAV